LLDYRSLSRANSSYILARFWINGVNSTMIYIGIGIFGFIIIHLFDLVSLKRIPLGAKPITWTAGFAILIFSLIKLCLQSNTLSIPVPLTWLGWLLLAVSLMMISFALFINLPFRKTYVSAGVGDKLVKTGSSRQGYTPWFVTRVSIG